MSSSNEKNNRYLLTDWKPENPGFWENKGKHYCAQKPLDISGCLLLAFCVWMLFSAVAVNLNKIGFNFTTDQLFFINGIAISFWCNITRALLLYGTYIWWSSLDHFSTIILVIPCVWLRICRAKYRYSVWRIYNHCADVVLLALTLPPAWAISAFSSQSEARQRIRR